MSPEDPTYDFQLEFLAIAARAAFRTACITFVMCNRPWFENVGGKVPFSVIYSGVYSFLTSLVVAGVLLFVFPQSALWLPGILMSQ